MNAIASRLDQRKGLQSMLILSRKVDEKILIGEDITILICRISGTVVKVGIEAPEGVKILRGELPKHCPDETREGRPPIEKGND